MRWPMMKMIMITIDDRFDKGELPTCGQSDFTQATLPCVERGDGDAALHAEAVYGEARGREVVDEDGPAVLM